MKEVFINNIKCKIGNNAEENWKLLDDASENLDYPLYLKNE